MRAFSAAMAAHLAGDVLRLCWCLKLERRDDGQWFFLGNHQFDVTFAGDLYRRGAFDARSVETRDDLSAAQLEAQVLFVPAAAGIVQRDDLRKGRFRNARFRYYLVNYDTPDTINHLWDAGTLGRIEATDAGWLLELRNRTELLQVSTGRKATEDCDVNLFHPRCGVVAEPPDWQAATEVFVRHAHDARQGDTRRPTNHGLDIVLECAVAGVTDAMEPAWDTTYGNTTVEAGGVEWVARPALTVDRTVATVDGDRAFAVASHPEPDDWFRYGRVLWLDGDNVGFQTEIESYRQSDGRVVTKFPHDDAIQPGDALRLWAGCDRGLECQAKFRNAWNQQAVAKLAPGAKAAAQFPDQKT